MYSGAGYGCCWESDRTNISRYSCQQCDIKCVAFSIWFCFPLALVDWPCPMDGDRTTCCLEYEFCVSCCLNPSQEQRVASWLQLNIEGTTRSNCDCPLLMSGFTFTRLPRARGDGASFSIRAVPRPVPHVISLDSATAHLHLALSLLLCWCTIIASSTFM